MSKTRWAPPAAALACFLLTASPALAQRVNRAWVSGHGTDAAGCGAPTTPCRSLQYVLDSVVASGGEIDILDPAGYGAVNITEPISIVNDGVGTAGVQSSNYYGIIVDTLGPTDAVHLRGLTIEGLGTGSAGIFYQSAGTLEVINCTVRNFGYGMEISPSGPLSLLISNTFVLGNGFGAGLGGGILIEASGGATIASVNNATVSDNTGYGISVSTAALVEVQISDSHIDNNTVTGIDLKGSPSPEPADVVLLGSTINQTPTALKLEGNANVWLSHDVLTAVPGLPNTGISLTGTNNNVLSDATSHLNSGPLPVWGFE